MSDCNGMCTITVTRVTDKPTSCTWTESAANPGCLISLANRQWPRLSGIVQGSPGGCFFFRLLCTGISTPGSGRVGTWNWQKKVVDWWIRPNKSPSKCDCNSARWRFGFDLPARQMTYNRRKHENRCRKHPTFHQTSLGSNTEYDKILVTCGTVHSSQMVANDRNKRMFHTKHYIYIYMRWCDGHRRCQIEISSTSNELFKTEYPSSGSWFIAEFLFECSCEVPRLFSQSSTPWEYHHRGTESDILTNSDAHF